ncbi:50S ribosomal protein L37e [Candidatus Woesearchaeota archaeon]|nr:50S ribosomal protein L37e [Candidatus Woesearchaeota archaeon]
MAKGTASMGKRSKGKSHIICRRCGRHSYHAQKGVCASCGYGKTARKREYSWQNKHGDY